MLSFGRLLHGAISDRGLTGSEFARMVGVHPSAINKAMRDAHVPRWKRGPQWADALNLQGKERADFLEALDLANSPPSIQRLVRRLRRGR